MIQANEPIVGIQLATVHAFKKKDCTKKFFHHIHDVAWHNVGIVDLITQEQYDKDRFFATFAIVAKWKIYLK